MKKYSTEQIDTIVGFVNDFVDWVNTQLDKEMSNITTISFAATPEYRAKVEGKTETYSKCIHHLTEVAKQLVTDSFGEILK